MSAWLRPDPQSERLYRRDRQTRRDEQERIENEWTAAQEKLMEQADRLMDEENDAKAEKESQKSDSSLQDAPGTTIDGQKVS